MNRLILINIAIPIFLLASSCKESITRDTKVNTDSIAVVNETPEYFNLRPTLEKQYGYSHAVKIGNHLKISGAVSMTDSGIVIGPGNMEVQMKNCYGDLEKILRHYGY